MPMSSSSAVPEVHDFAPAPTAPAAGDPMVHPLIEVRHSPVHGHGVFAKVDLPAGSFLAQYEGRRYTAYQMGRGDWDDKVTYLFGLSDGTTIDGAQGGNVTRHLNHACVPNCEAVEDSEKPMGAKRKRLAVRIFTTIAVAKGEELFLDYALTIDNEADRAAYRCFCAAEACRGDMVGPA